MKYNYPIHRAKNLDSAVRLARYLKQSGEYDLFRGQNQNFPLTPSIFRGGQGTAVAMARLNQLSSWISQQQELSSLHKNKDATIAVAQHYRIPTPFLDFTKDPDVAAFFASHVSSTAQPKKMMRDACIICANRKLLEESWADINARHRADEGTDLVRVVDMDVNNLWRLHAQSGLFLDVRVDNTMLEMFSFFLHIEFPRKDTTIDLDVYNKYYPVNKSHMELLLDQYFLIESYPAREKQLLESFEQKIVVGPNDFRGEPTSFLNETFPPRHESWSGDVISLWLQEPVEKYDGRDDGRIKTLIVNLTSDPKSAFIALREQLRLLFEKQDIRPQLNVGWSVTDTRGAPVYSAYDRANGSKNPALVSEGVRLIFDGMRGKPYSDVNIEVALATYVCLACFPAWETMNKLWGELIGVEMDGAGVRSRGFCGVEALTAALREDFADYLVPREIEALRTGGISEALGMLIEPSRMFVFDDFAKAFAEQVIPSIVLQRIEDVLHFNVAKLRVFGRS
jgi:hypothetical protein